jgi:hypothetical protein
MKINPSTRARRLACTAILSGAAQIAAAVDFGNDFALHGYGSQDYVQSSSDRNTYLGADHRGTWDNNFLAFVATVSLNERSKLWAQLETSSMDATRFTWFFVDYALTDALTAHVGRVKFPLGLYNETIDVKFLQMSSLEPSIYQIAADFVHDSYTGVGVDYTQDLGTAGRITWQVYGGNAYDTNPPADSRDRRMAGGRVTYATPVDGLRFMVSSYRTQVELLATRELVNETRVIGSIDYVQADWDLKAEYAAQSFDGVDSDGYYIQAGRTLADKWTPFVRYDYVTTDKSLAAGDAWHQKTVVGGINYKLLGNVSLRGEVHANRGFALPFASGEANPATAKRDWTLFVVGLHFIF